MEQLFNDTIDTVFEIFGEEAFLPPKYERQTNKPQKTIYDPLMQSIAKHIAEKEKLLSQAEAIKENKYNNPHEINGERLFYGRNTSPGVVKTRIDYFDNLLALYL